MKRKEKEENENENEEEEIKPSKREKSFEDSINGFDYVTHFPKVNLFIPGIQPRIKLNSTITIYGKRGTGKSFFLRWFLVTGYQEYFPWGWCFTKTKHNSQYSITMPDTFIIEDFTDDILLKIMSRQILARELAQMEGSDVNPLSFVIFDDNPDRTNITFSEITSRYYTLGRHYGIMTCFCAQKMTMTPTVIRENTDLVVFFNSDTKRHLDGMAEDFAGKMIKREFVNWVSSYLEEPRMFFAINNDPNCPLDEKFYYGKAEYVDVTIDNVMGCVEYWKDDHKQLREIEDGTLERKREKWEQIVEPWNKDKVVCDSKKSNNKK